MKQQWADSEQKGDTGRGRMHDGTTMEPFLVCWYLEDPTMPEVVHKLIWLVVCNMNFMTSTYWEFHHPN